MVGFSLGWVWVGSGEVEFAGREGEEAGFGFACNSQHPLPSSSPHHYSFCLLLMRLLTLINVFFSFPTTLPVTFASCFTSAKGEGATGFGFRFPFEIPFYCSLVKRVGGERGQALRELRGLLLELRVY